jgi:adenosylhomocysteine nucleosidase
MGNFEVKKIGIVVAMREERKHLLRGRRFTQGRVARFPFFSFEGACRSVRIVETGMGAANAADGTKALLAEFPADLLVSIGFGGGGTEGIMPGEIFVADRLVRYRKEGVEEGSYPLFAPHPGLPVKFRTGTFVTTDGVEPKRRLAKFLGKRYGDAVVEMETWWVAEVASARGIPLLAIRGISDGSGEEILLPLDRITNVNGQVSVLRVLAEVAKKPTLLPHLLRLGRNSSLAGKNLANFLDALLQSP